MTKNQNMKNKEQKIMKSTLKKSLSLILSLTLVLSLGTVAFAETLPNNSALEGSGEAEYLDLERYSVVLPTNAALNFTLDPQGLLSIEDGTTVDLADLTGGTIVPAAGDARVINNSAVDLKVSVELKGTGDATFVEFDTDDETTIAAVEDGTDENVLLYAVPAAVNIVNATTVYSAASNGYIIDSTGITLDFVLGKAQYEIENIGGTYTASAKADTGNGTALTLGGYVNTGADWSDYDGTASEIGLTAVFSYAKATGNEGAAIEGIPGLLASNTADYLTLAPASTVGFPGTTKSLTISKAAANTVIDFDFDGATALTERSLDGTVLATSAFNNLFTINYATGKITVLGSGFTAKPGVQVVKFKAAGVEYTLNLTVNA
jgi:hypothetical protein